MTKQGFHASAVNRFLILVIVLLSVVTLALAITVISLATSKCKNPHHQEQSYNGRIVMEKQIFLKEEPDIPPVFHDLTKSEVEGIQRYLYKHSNLNLVQPKTNKTNASYVFTIELYLPEKIDVLKYLEENGPKPSRMAKVTIFRASVQNSEINVIIVEPLPNPSSHRPVPGRPASIPFFYQPISYDEYYSAIDFISNELEGKAGEFMMAAFGARLKNCGSRCLSLQYLNAFSPASSGEKKRKMWYWLHYLVEYFLLHPVDFAVLILSDKNSVVVESVWYSGRTYNSLDALIDQYNQNKLPLNISTFPTDDSFSFSKLHRRGKAPQLSERRDPIQFYPDGQRYTVKHRHIEYMDWSFDFRLSTSYGPQIYDIRFKRK